MSEADERPTLPLSWDDWKMRTSWVRAQPGRVCPASVGLGDEPGWWLVSTSAAVALDHAGELAMFDVLLFAKRRPRLPVGFNDVCESKASYARACPVCAAPVSSLCMREGPFRSRAEMSEYWPNSYVHRARTEAGDK